MRKLSKILSVGLSLAMCAGLVMPSFAAVALDKDRHIDRDGYLLENEEKNYDYYLDQDIELDQTLVIVAGATASIDLNGHDLMLNDTVEAKYDKDGYLEELTVSNSHGDTKEGSVIQVEKGAELTIDDSKATGSAEDGTYVSGKITGGNSTFGGGIQNNGTLTLNGGIISGNTATYTGGGIQNNGTLTLNGGIISGNMARYNGGGGVLSGVNSTFIMNGGKITGNTVNGVGAGGGGVCNSGTFTMSGGEISGNTATMTGGGVSSFDTFTMSGGTISGNTAKKSGGGVYVVGAKDFTMTGGTISGNTANNGGGVYNYTDKFTMSGGEISGNTAKESGGGVYSAGNSKYPANFTMTGGIIADNNKVGTEKVAVTAGEYSTLKGTRWVYEKIDEVKEYVPGEDGKVVETVDIRPAQLDEDGNIIIDPGKTAVDKDGEKVELPYGGVIDKDGNVIPNKAPSAGGNYFDFGETEIEDVAVPLAGLFTRADAIGYLWEKSGSPEWALSDFPDVPADHQWAVAIGWAQDMGIALPDLEGNFRPDDLVLRSVEDLKLSPEGELEQFLNRYAVYAGIELDEGELFIALDGEWDEIIMGEDAQIIFDDFFAKLEAALADLAA